MAGRHFIIARSLLLRFSSLAIIAQLLDKLGQGYEFNLDISLLRIS